MNTQFHSWNCKSSKKIVCWCMAFIRQLTGPGIKIFCCKNQRQKNARLAPRVVLYLMDRIKFPVCKGEESTKICIVSLLRIHFVSWLNYDIQLRFEHPFFSFLVSNICVCSMLCWKIKVHITSETTKKCHEREKCQSWKLNDFKFKYRFFQFQKFNFNDLSPFPLTSQMQCTI